MKKYPRAEADEWTVLFWATSVTLTMVTVFAISFRLLFQPAVYENPGLAGYSPPPGTRLVPLPRKTDAPQLADLPDLPPPTSEPLSTALAQTQFADKQARPPAVHKRPQVSRRENERTRGYSSPGNYAYGDWSGNHAWSGGFKNWF
jgi:hypothetical protein